MERLFYWKQESKRVRDGDIFGIGHFTAEAQSRKERRDHFAFAPRTLRLGASAVNE
jgi:hypothetical protein